MPTGSCGRFLFGRFATPSARTKPPGRAAQKLVRRPNKRTQPLRVGEHCSTALPVTESTARRRGRGRRGARPAQLLGASCWARRAQHEHAAQHFLNRSPCRRRRRFRAAARAAATSKSGRDAVAAPRRRDQHPRPRAAALRRSPRATTKRRPIRRSTRPRAAAAPRGNASRRHKTCVGPAVGRRRRRPDPGICARRDVPRPPTRTARTSRTL